MCKIAELEWDRVLSENEAVIGAREFSLSFSNELIPAYGPGQRIAPKTWAPCRSPYFWAHKTPSYTVNNSAGIYAYPCNLDTLLSQLPNYRITGVVSLFGQVLYGRTFSGTLIYVAEWARLDALIIPRTKRYNYSSNEIADIMANYLDVPILEV